MVAGPMLAAVQHHEIALRNHAHELDVLAGIVLGRLLEVSDESLLAVADARIVLDIVCAHIALDGFARPRLIEHQVVELGHGALVAFEPEGHCMTRAPGTRPLSTELGARVVASATAAFISRRPRRRGPVAGRAGTVRRARVAVPSA